MSWEGVRDATVAVVGSVPTIGPVHTRQRYSKNPTDYKALFRDPTSGAIRCAIVTRRGATSRRLAHKRIEVGHGVRVLVIEGVNDGNDSETTWRNHVEAVRHALDQAGESPDGRLAQAALRIEPAEVLVEEFRLFGDVFSHYGEVGCRVYATEDLA